MPINNQKGLDALRALSTGGSAGLDSYKAAQGAEQASRTTALQNALGSTDVAAAAAKAQAQYAPKVAGTGVNMDSLQSAADNYLSNAANKLSAQQYENQQNLALQSEALNRQSNEKDLKYRLAGAADAMAANQAANVEANQGLAPQLGNLAQRRDEKRNQLTEFDKGAAAIANQAANLAAHGAGDQAQALLAQRDEQRNTILREMAGIDEQYGKTANQYASFLGTDTKGLMDAYHQGNADVVRGNVGSENMIGALQESLGKGRREVEMGEQGRLRELAPAFGIDPLTAAGMFREGEGNDLSRIGQRGKQQDYVEGQDPEAMAGSLGFGSAADLKATAKSSGLNPSEMASAMSDPSWQGVDDLANAFTAGDQTNELVAGRSGTEGFKSALQDYVGRQYPITEGMTEAEKRQINAARTKIINLAIGVYKNRINAATGKGEAGGEEE